MAVRQHLNLHVARVQQEFLDIDLGVAEGATRGSFSIVAAEGRLANQMVTGDASVGEEEVEMFTATLQV